MSSKTRPKIADQVVVVLGASSGIGRETALRFAERGARVVLAARDELALYALADEIKRTGGTATVIPTDVAEWAQVRKLAQTTIDRFGHIDTWANIAAAAEYAPVIDAPVEDIERVIHVILLGEIHGIKAALEVMRPRDVGTIINVTSMLARVPVPYLSSYCAAKHGLDGFIETLFLELKHERSNITVTQILPASINTPFFAHARSLIGVEPVPPPPIYEPGAVAEAITFAAEHPRREIVVGGSAKAFVVLYRLSPALYDRMMLFRGLGERMQRSDQPPTKRDILYTPAHEHGSVTGDHGTFTFKRSLYTRYIEQHPVVKRVAVGATLAGAVWLARRVGRPAA